VSVTLNVPVTDATGVTEATGTIGDLADTTLPLKAVVKVSIHEPGGRTTDKTSRDSRPHARCGDRHPSGFRQRFRRTRTRKAGFEAIAVNGDGKRIALSGLTYTWVREDTTYQWYQDSGTSGNTSRSRATGDHQRHARHRHRRAAKLAQAFPWGAYRLTITDPKSGREFLSLLFRLGGECLRRQAGPHSRCGEQAVLQAAGEVAHISIKPASDGRRSSSWRATASSPRR
jgi:uncharacterized protein YfaS (alpha-2-macroglobulin family)